MNTSLEGIDVVDYFTCVVFNPVNGVVYACDGAGKMVLMDGAKDTILGSVHVGSLPSSAAINARNGEVYVTNWGSDNVSVISGATNAVVGDIRVGSEPDAVAYDSANGYLYVANNASNNVTVIDGASGAVVKSIAVGCNPDAVAYDSVNGNLYVANSCSGNLTVINGASNTTVGSIRVGSYPVAMAFASANNRLYVANGGSDNVTVVAPGPPPKFPVRFVESGLPEGSNWSVSMNGTLKSSTDASLLFWEPSGNYSYSTPREGFFATYRGGGQFAVNGSSVEIAIQFAFTSTLRLVVTGLPTGNSWTVSVTNSTVWVSLLEVVNGSGVGFVIFANVSYSYAITFPQNFSAWDVAGNVTLGEAGATIVVPIHSGSSGISSPSWPLVAVIAAVAATAVGATYVLLRDRRPPGPE